MLNKFFFSKMCIKKPCNTFVAFLKFSIPAKYKCYSIDCAGPNSSKFCSKKRKIMWDYVVDPVFQSRISAKPGLIFKLLLWFIQFCGIVGFKTIKPKSSIEPENIVKLHKQSS